MKYIQYSRIQSSLAAPSIPLILKKPLDLKDVLPFLVPEQVPEWEIWMASKRRHWKEKDGRFWARLSIPAALRPLFGNKTQLTEPLGGDLRVADRNHAAAVARLQAKLDKARIQVATEKIPASTPVPRPLTVHDRELVVWEHYTRTLRAIEEKRASMPTPAEIEVEYELAMQRIEAGEANPDRGIASQINLSTD